MEEDNGITTELINEILDRIKIILDLKAPVLPANPTQEQIAKYNEELAEYNSIINLLTLYIRMVCENILIRINRRKFVPDLKNVVINMVLDKYEALKANIDTSSIQSIQSMSEYDRTVSFGVSDAVKTRLNLLAEQQIIDNDRLINRFRLLYKV